jgi:hypothetical protein
VLRVVLVPQEQLGLKELKELKVTKDLRVPKEHRGLKDPLLINDLRQIFRLSPIR